ncbi:hypothetical protein JCM10908_007226 [Rhodotorula pacifica]|uniref:beclin 1 n=1 Tax=Rhodotorula pacifica TaxID=1495444 RepID=UPI00316D6EE3
MSINANCQRCRQPLIPSSLPHFPPPPSSSRIAHPHQQYATAPRAGHAQAQVQDSIAALSPSAYDFLSASDRFTPATPAAAAAPPPPSPVTTTTTARRLPYPQMYNVARTQRPQPGGVAPSPIERIVVPPPPLPSQQQQQSRRNLGPQDSYIVLTDSVISRPAPPSGGSNNTDQDSSGGAAGGAVSGPGGQGGLVSDTHEQAASSSSSSDSNNSLQVHLAQLSNLYALLSSPPAPSSSSSTSPATPSNSGGTGLSHPLCTECTELLFDLMTRELDSLKKERDRLIGFEKDVMKRREETVRQLKAVAAAAAPAGSASEVDIKEALEKDIAKLRKAESHAIAELKAVEAQKASLATDRAALDAEEAQLAKEEAEFWKQHSKYLLRRDELQDREESLRTRLSNGHRELEKLQRTNVYNDAFCIGQEAGFGTINGLRLGRLPGINVEWPEINAAWGHTLLLLSTIAHKFGFHHFRGYRLVPCGSFSTIEKLEEDATIAGTGGEDGEGSALGRDGGGGAVGGLGEVPESQEGKGVVAVYELYGSGDFAVTRLLQNRRFDMAMVAFLECLRQLVEFVTARDPKVRVPHAVVKDRIGDVSIKLQFGSDEAWTRALRHVLLDLKILLSRASL